MIGEEKITGWQLRDIFDENKNFNHIKKKLAQKITQNEMILKGLIKEEDIDD